ncbi:MULTISPECIES: hypothetical protein [Actinomadura]|uniref:Uncharacterized protein n=1 Tax=Actinomadura litoris TaxID=2678616 RepID=A0A7K1KYT9_9ACTN|nr:MULTISPECIES: hypothetical protein [Actinomadura]MBT2212295.1 hypothetical protein [Actinomadura sp. NEAU-AAG7]MUN37213.1 hypothetical protein [Actinomadura litoris]
MAVPSLVRAYLCLSSGSRCPPAWAGPTGYPGSSAAPRRAGEVPLGRRTKAELTADSPTLVVKAHGSSIESTEDENSYAEWYWTVTPHQKGRYLMVLTMTPLGGGSDEPVAASRKFLFPVVVTEKSAPASRRISMAGRTIKSELVWASALAGTCATLFVAVLEGRRNTRDARSGPGPERDEVEP